MKKVGLIILVLLFSWSSVAASPFPSISDDHKKNEQKKKDPPGPPVVKSKGKEAPKEPPKRDKKP
jgi:hypothetical protein